MAKTAEELVLRVIVEDKEVSAQLALTDKNVQALVKRMQEYGRESKEVTAKTGAMNQAFGQFGWVLGDAGGFMVNFRMGMMSIGNNIPMVVQALAAAKQEAKDVGKSFGSLAMDAIKGPGGLMLAVNGLMLLLQVLPGLFGESAEEAQKTADAIDELSRSATKLTKLQIMQRQGVAKMFLADTEAKAEAERNEIVRKWKDKEGNEYVQRREKATPETQALINSLREEIAMYQRIFDEMGIITDLENQRANLELRRREAKTPQEIAQINAALSVVEKKLKAYEPKRERKKSSLPLSFEADLTARKFMRGYDDMYVPIADQVQVLGNMTPGDTMHPVAVPEKPKAAIAETNAELQTQLELTNAVAQGFYSAGSAMANAMSKSIYLFKEANSVAQLFLNTLVQVAFQQLALAGVRAGMTFLGIPIPGLATGGIVTRPTLAVVGEAGPEAVVPLSRYQPAQNVNVTLSGELGIELDRLRVELKKMENFRKSFK